MNFFVHSFESLAAVDGEGLRYAIFLSGCPLKCACCHNPDTQGPIRGKEYSPADVVKRVKRYKPYFGAKGGVTFSGGEPLLQSEAICSAAPLLRAEGISYAVDTSGCVPLTPAVKQALGGAALVICDLKFFDENSFRFYTGGRLQDELNCLEFLSLCGVPTWVRTVIIPGVNDDEESIRRYVDLVRRYRVKKYTLLGFHTLGFHKYEALGIKNRLLSTPPLKPARLEYLQALANELLKK